MATETPSATDPVLAHLSWDDWHADGLSILNAPAGGVILDILGLLTPEQLARVDRSLDDVREALGSIMELNARPEWDGVRELEASARAEGATAMHDELLGALEWATERAAVCGLEVPDVLEIARSVDPETVAAQLGGGAE